MTGSRDAQLQVRLEDEPLELSVVHLHRVENAAAILGCAAAGDDQALAGEDANRGEVVPSVIHKGRKQGRDT